MIPYNNKEGISENKEGSCFGFHFDHHVIPTILSSTLFESLHGEPKI
jgi:hypothetical protein